VSPEYRPRVRRTEWRSAFVTALALMLSSAAHAQPKPAPATEVDPNDPWEVGKAAYDAGRLDEALSAFELSYKQTKRPRALYRVGDTADKLGQSARAISAFQEYLRLVPAAKDRPFVESRIRANEVIVAHSPPPPPMAAQPATEEMSADAPAAQTPSAPTAATAASPSSSSSGAGPVWLWAGAGVLAVTAIVVAGVLMGSSSASSTPAPIRGNVGGTIQTLGVP